jgi:hypothetical protein
MSLCATKFDAVTAASETSAISDVFAAVFVVPGVNDPAATVEVERNIRHTVAAADPTGFNRTSSAQAQRLRLARPGYGNKSGWCWRPCPNSSTKGRAERDGSGDAIAGRVKIIAARRDEDR